MNAALANLISLALVALCITSLIVLYHFTPRRHP